MPLGHLAADHRDRTERQWSSVPVGWNLEGRKGTNNPEQSVNAGVIVVGKNSDGPVEVRHAHAKIVCRSVFEKVKELLKQGASKLGAS